MILTNCRLIPELSDGISSEDGAVVIRDGMVVDIFADTSIPMQYVSEDKYDCQGMTLLPGLIDMHTHIAALGRVGADRAHDKMGLLVAAAKHATQYLDNGFTTIRDCASTLRCANYVREMAADGIIDAPDIISCGCALMPTEVDPGNPLALHLVAADGRDEMIKAARIEMAYGADFVKIFASGAAANPNGVPTQAIMSAEEIAASTEAAARKGTYVSAHCHSDDAIRLCVENGVRTIEHATLISDDTLDMILRNDNVTMIPTLAVMRIGDGPSREYWLRRLGPMFDHCTAMMSKAYKAGAVLGFGTDCAAGSYEYDNGTEFRFRKENCGMKDIDILIQATSVNAKIAGLGDKVGEIKKGLRADLILVDGKPDEDISAMYKKPECVWKRGKKVR